MTEKETWADRIAKAKEAREAGKKLREIERIVPYVGLEPYELSRLVNR